jgi:hypothetical protein
MAQFIYLSNKMYVYVSCETLFISVVTGSAERGPNFSNNLECVVWLQ